MLSCSDIRRCANKSHCQRVEYIYIICSSKYTNDQYKNRQWTEYQGNISNEVLWQCEIQIYTCMRTYTHHKNPHCCTQRIISLQSTLISHYTTGHHTLPRHNTPPLPHATPQLPHITAPPHTTSCHPAPHHHHTTPHRTTLTLHYSSAPPHPITPHHNHLNLFLLLHHTLSPRTTPLHTHPILLLFSHHTLSPRTTPPSRHTTPLSIPTTLPYHVTTYVP